MKFFTVLAAIVAVACASPAEWTIPELSAAIQNPATPVALMPILEEALNDLMLQAFTGTGQSTTTVSTAVQEFSSWTLHELSEAIQDPATDAELLVYLEHALNNMMLEIMSGGQPEAVIVATPVGLLPAGTAVAPAPADSAVAPAPADSAVVPAPAETASPLVQIIINVNQQQANPSPAEEPVNPMPVNPVDIISVNPINPVIPEPIVLPQPVMPEVVVPEPIVLPQPVMPEVVVPEPIVLPQPVMPEVVVPEPVVLPQPVMPEVIVPEPVVLPEPAMPEVIIPVNPIDGIAISPPEVNPIDLLAPLPVHPVGAINVVGPIM